ncbi:hypothetical protein ACU5AY_13660 [Rhizobium sp. PAMB 3174]
MRRSLFALTLIASLAAGQAYAHAPRPGPNGGVKVDAGANHHVELVVGGTDQVTVYLFDSADQPVPAAGYAASAILLVDGAAQRFALTPGEGNSLVGIYPVAIPSGVKGAIKITAPDGSTAQAKF